MASNESIAHAFVYDFILRRSQTLAELYRMEFDPIILSKRIPRLENLIEEVFNSENYDLKVILKPLVSQYALSSTSLSSEVKNEPSSVRKPSAAVATRKPCRARRLNINNNDEQSILKRTAPLASPTRTTRKRQRENFKTRAKSLSKASAGNNTEQEDEEESTEEEEEREKEQSDEEEEESIEREHSVDDKTDNSDATGDSEHEARQVESTDEEEDLQQPMPKKVKYTTFNEYGRQQQKNASKTASFKHGTRSNNNAGERKNVVNGINLGGYPEFPPNWDCPGCGWSNFFKRGYCCKCLTGNPNGFYPKNWRCAVCLFSNFAFRYVCYKCCRPNPDGECAGAKA